jgi:small subunit ribosomal protein S9
MADEPEQPETTEPEQHPEPAAPEQRAEAVAEAPSSDAEEAPKPKAQKRRRKTEPASAQAGEPEAQAASDAEAAPASQGDGEAVAAAEPTEAADTAEAPAKAEAAEASAPAEAAGEAAAGEPGERSRAKPEVPGAHLEVDIVPEGVDPLGREQEDVDPYAVGFEEEEAEQVVAEGEGEVEVAREEQEEAQPIVSAAIDLAAGARYSATGKRKTAVARVILRPGKGAYTINGRSLLEYFPRATLQRNIAQPLEAVGYEERMDVFARLHGGGVSSQAGALRHGISRALLEADPNLRGELKRRGFLTRDSRVKERKKAGLKKARKRPQFSKR